MSNSTINKKYAINLYKTNMYYNPLSVAYKNKEYTLNNIHFYDKDNIIISTSHGWFGRSSFNVSLPTAKELTLKRKKDLSKNEPFIIKSDYGNEYELYLPISDFNISRKYRKIGDMIMGDYSFIANNDIICNWSNCVKYLGKEIFQIKTEYDKILKELENINNLKENNFFDKLNNLKMTFNKYQETVKKWNNYTVQDYLKEYPETNQQYFNN